MKCLLLDLESYLQRNRLSVTAYVAHLAAGVNLMLLPESSLTFAIAGMTSPAGRSHTFDRRADGFARGEGCVAVALEMSAAAPVCSVLGSCVRQDRPRP